MKPDEIESVLNDKIEKNKKIIADSIRKLENTVIDLSSKIEVKKDGSIVGPSRSLSQARSMLKDTAAAFDSIYMQDVELTHDYSDIDAIIQDYVGAQYSGVTSDSLLALISIDTSIHDSLSQQTQDRLSSVIFDHVLTGNQKSDLIDSIRSILTGIVDGAGRPMSSHASTITQDALMDYYATANLMTAKDAGIDEFQYFGSLIADSRQWCVDHVDGIFTRKEIDAFDGDYWAGKKAGSTIINRGGYGCRHSWLPII